MCLDTLICRTLPTAWSWGQSVTHKSLMKNKAGLIYLHFVQFCTILQNIDNPPVSENFNICIKKSVAISGHQGPWDKLFK
jgi:hypothetical protein